MRLSRHALRPDPARRVSFRFDGEAVAAYAGESVAAALAAAGRPALRRAGEGWRGLYCGMGACQDCAVTVDGRAGIRACLHPVAGGEEIRSVPPSGAPDDPLRPLTPPPIGAATPEEAVQILVIGAGPAGLAAAIAARRAGASVVVLDERAAPGGQYFKGPAASVRHSGGLDRQHRAGAALRAQAAALAIDIRAGAEVFGAFAADDVIALQDGRARLFRPERLILATGAYERAAPFPGWTLPGVMTTGAAQTLARAYGVAPGRRILIAGAGPLNFQLGAELAEAGADVVAVLERAPRPGLREIGAVMRAARAAPGLMATGAGYLARLQRAGAPVRWSAAITRAEGGPLGVTAAEIAPLTADGRLERQRAERIELDAVCVGEGLVAATEIARALGCEMTADPRHLGGLAVATDASGRTSVDGVFAAGDGARPAGAPLALIDGDAAGRAAARSLGYDAPDPAGRPRRRAAAAAFQTALWRLFAAPPLRLEQTPDETILCRCEALSFGRIRAEIRGGWTRPAAIKRRTRLGMGRCQGRYCAATLAKLLEETTGRPRGAEEGFAPRLPAKPFPAAALMREKPEWGGHARAGTPDLSRREPALDRPAAPAEAEIVIIGAGVVGACLAYYLAAAGRDTLVIDREDVNLQASGGNAGSLHVQLLSFDFGAKAEAGGGPAADTLPLGPWSIALWRDLADAARALPDAPDFEIKTTGGLMVAESAAGLRFLEAKTALERARGIEAHVIDAAALRDLAPALSEQLVGAAFAPQEGKINPLTATYGVWALAEAAGARLLRGADVQALTPSRSGWRVRTARGTIKAGRVINAAGPWARPVAALAGVDAPVHSAPLQMLVTEPAPRLIEPLLAHADRHLSLKQLGAGGLVIGGAWTAAYAPARRLNIALRESVEGNLWVAGRVLPALGGLRLLRAWAAMNVNIDGAPILGEAPGARGFFNAVTSNGYTLAPAVARLTADLILGGAARRDIAPFTLARFETAERSRSAAPDTPSPLSRHGGSRRP